MDAGRSVGRSLTEWKYQVLIQLPGAGLTHRRRVVDFERRIETIGADVPAELAGHGWGPEEINVIAFTDRPGAFCERVLELADEDGTPRDFTLAYRELDGGEWTVVRPQGLAAIGEPGLDWGYRLTVEFPLRKTDGHAFWERIDDIAARISERLGDGPEAVFDGRSMTADAIRIEILADDPEATLRQLHPVLAERAPRADFLVAYARARGGDRTLLYQASPASSTPDITDDRDGVETGLRFQLVIQFSAADGDLGAFDRLTDLEERIDAVLTDDANDVVDGHDNGSGEMNVFILTNTPAETFARIHAVVGKHGPQASFRAAYRAIDENRFTILWPTDLKAFDVA